MNFGAVRGNLLEVGWDFLYISQCLNEWLSAKGRWTRVAFLPSRCPVRLQRQRELLNFENTHTALT